MGFVHVGESRSPGTAPRRTAQGSMQARFSVARNLHCEDSAGRQPAPHSRQQRRLVGYPLQGGVGENQVEAAARLPGSAVGDDPLGTPRPLDPGRRDHLGRTVHADELGAGEDRREDGRRVAGAAAQVEGGRPRWRAAAPPARPPAGRLRPRRRRARSARSRAGRVARPELQVRQVPIGMRSPRGRPARGSGGRRRRETVTMPLR